MLKLYGFPVSNYTQMVSFALHEKGIEYEAVSTQPSQEGDYKAKSPMGKVPCIEVDKGFLSETDAIMECIDEVHPNPPLLPADPFARAKVREIMKVLELYFELPARRHYPEIFFGEGRSDAAFEEVKPVLENGIAALNQLCSFGPYLAGEFSMADIMAAYTFCYAAPVAQAIYGMDLMAEIPGLAAAIEATNARPAGKIVAAEHAEALAAFQAAQ
jgi:glutathione S-transferase